MAFFPGRSDLRPQQGFVEFLGPRGQEDLQLGFVEVDEGVDVRVPHPQLRRQVAVGVAQGQQASGQRLGDQEGALALDRPHPLLVVVHHLDQRDGLIRSRGCLQVALAFHQRRALMVSRQGAKHGETAERDGSEHVVGLLRVAGVAAAQGHAKQQEVP